MTDRTQPETGGTHIIRYALEMGLLWIDGDGRDKVREALDALDTLEAQLEAIGAGGVNGPMMGQPQAMPDLTALTERGAAAWAGVDAQALREGRWYMVNKDGMATLCADEADAEREAADAQAIWPGMGPHRAVQLVDAGRASISANAESEPVYQARYQKGFWQDSSRERCEYLQNPENTCAEDWETRILYTRPPTSAEGVEP